MSNPLQSSSSKAKVRHLDFSHLALKHISPPASYITLNSPTTRDPDNRFPLTKTSTSSPRNGPPKYNLYERNRSVNALPLIQQQKVCSVGSSMQNIKELKTEENEIFQSPVTSMNKEAAFYMMGSSGKPKKTKPDESLTYGLGQLSMYKVNITRDQQQPAPCPPTQQEPLIDTLDKASKPTQPPESPRSRNAFLFKTKGYFDIETLAKTGLKSPSNKKNEGSQLSMTGTSKNVSMIKNISLRERSNQPIQTIQSAKASIKLEEVLKGCEEPPLSARRRVDLSPESGYLLSDRQRMEKANSYKKKNLKINLDSQVMKCFGDIRSTMAGSLTQRPQLNMFPLYTSHKRFPNAARMDVSMIKDLCKDVVVSGKKSGIMNL